MTVGLALAELELLASLRTARLLALDGTCVAREETEATKLATMTFVHLHQRASDGETKGTSLTACATALEIRLDVELAKGIGGDERLLDLGDEHRTREVVAE